MGGVELFNRYRMMPSSSISLIRSCFLRQRLIKLLAIQKTVRVNSTFALISTATVYVKLKIRIYWFNIYNTTKKPNISNERFLWKTEKMKNRKLSLWKMMRTNTTKHHHRSHPTRSNNRWSITIFNDSEFKEMGRLSLKPVFILETNQLLC